MDKTQHIESARSPELTIIVVSWNTSKMTRACLASVVAHSANLHLRVVVVDNGSTDDSCACIRLEFPQVELIENRHNVGFAAANNQILRNVTTPFVLLLNSDTIVFPDTLRASLEYMRQHSDSGAMGCRVLNTDGSPQLTCARYPRLRYLGAKTMGFSNTFFPDWLDVYRMRGWKRDSFAEVETITGCYMLIRKDALRDAGLLDESFFFYGEETDWCYRLKQCGWKLTFAPVGEITHHGGGSAKKLNAKRDVYLTAGLVKLHWKHRGRLAASCAWLILAAFNLSRAVFWSICTRAGKNERAAERARHFTTVSAGLGEAWRMAAKGAPNVA